MENEDIKCPNCHWKGKLIELKVLKNSENKLYPSCGLVLTTTKPRLWDNRNHFWEM